MRPVIAEIEGEFWDSQVYRGKLFLFCRDGTIRTIDWDKLVDSLNFDRDARLAATCAFQRSDYLYGPNWNLFFSDSDIKKAITQKFRSLSLKNIQVDEKKLTNAEYGRQDNPFPFPHADTLLYIKQMYVVGTEGVWRSTCDPKRTRKPISSRPSKYWDAPTFSTAASYHSLALAAGKEGLWELDIARWSVYGDRATPRVLSSRDCDICGFMYFSVYGSSYSNGGFLAEFKIETSESHDMDQTQSHSRVYSREYSDQEIFSAGEPSRSWGARDKIYLFKNGQILVVAYNPYEDEQHFNYIGDSQATDSPASFVAGGVATFGAILEYDDHVVVVPSEGTPVKLHGEPIRWRVFPGSRFYQNQLHVIYDGCLKIYSFNQDYFVNQDRKLFGTRPYRR
jgi:hypothetical protein